MENMEATKTQLSRFTVDDFIDDAQLKQFYMTDMNNFLTNYEPGKPENKPKLMEQIRNMEIERNRRLADHNKMMDAQKRLYQNTNTLTNGEQRIVSYEKQIEDKVCLINELLKKIKDLTVELDYYKNK